MRPDDFAVLAKILRRRSGLSLGISKMALLERRLTPVMRRFGFKYADALAQALRLGHEALAEAVTEAMSVGETSFFRDPALFRQLEEQVLPPLQFARRHDKRLRIWSAACATGQEAYSLAMMLDEMGLQGAGWKVDLIATDLSAHAIARAEKGRYAACEVERGLGAERLARHFHPDGEGWLIAEKLRRMVSFRRFNLLNSFGWLDDIDLVLCRNVLIYFDRSTRMSLLERIAETLVPDGVLVTGVAETPRTMGGIFIELSQGSGLYGRADMPVLRIGAG